MNTIRKEDALEYHSQGKPGKIAVVPTKPALTQRDLSMAYSPGVAEPCLEIARDPSAVNLYTAKSNLVAVISNGTAVLGLGNIGALASKPVMEGKGVLFKVFADIDVFDIEVNATGVDEFCRVVKALEPTFGGINLEDIAAPACFEIEKRLKEEMNIPVMHDDQHGTAIIVGAAMLNAAELTDRALSDIKIVVSGAGASALSCIKILVALGCNQDNFLVFDKSGLITKDRTDLDEYKATVAVDRETMSLAEAMRGADAFLGLSAADVVSQDMVRSMAPEPIVFALANPNPEISYDAATSAREDIIMATGRSDTPNQVNNVLGFPFLFRGALDVRATAINEAMKLAAVRALAELAKKAVPDVVSNTYGLPNMTFNKSYIIPKPLDPRLITTVAPAVARAAIESGVAQETITDWAAYEESLLSRFGNNDRLSKNIINRAKKSRKRIVFAEGDNARIMKAAQQVKDEGIATPILLGNRQKITQMMADLNIDLRGVEILDPLMEDAQVDYFAAKFYKQRQRRGLTMAESVQHMRSRNYFASAMVKEGMADAMITGISRKYTASVRPIFQVLGKEKGLNTVAGLYIVLTQKGPLLLADTTINANPTVEQLVDIAELAHRAAQRLDLEPVMAMLSFSSYGSAHLESPAVMRQATELLKAKHPDWIIDGEIQANFALNQDLLKEYFPFSTLADRRVNTMIFPNLDSANISYKLLQSATGAEIMGPVLLGVARPAHVLQMGASVREIVNLTAIAAVDAEYYAKGQLADE